MRIYLLSGLGADQRLFGQLDAGTHHELIALPWIPPGASRSLGDYARLLHEHYQLEPPFILGGVSMGGMLAQEWAQLCRPEALLLISTATSRNDMAGFIRTAAALRISPVLNKSILELLGLIGDRFTAKSKEGRSLFKRMLRESDPDWLAFGARAILDWEPPLLRQPYLRLHGSADRVFPPADWPHCTLIDGGNHFMTFDRAAELSGHIRAFADGLQSKATAT